MIRLPLFRAIIPHLRPSSDSVRVPIQQPDECGHLQRSDQGLLTIRTFLIAGLFLWIAGLSHAQPLNLNQAQPPPPHSSNEAKHLKAISKSGEPIEQSPAPLPSNLNVTVGGKLELISETKETKAPEEQQKWLSEFVNVKATDIVLAAFTGLLALYTVFLYKATANLANIARQQESSTKTIERAWVKMSHTEDALIIWDNPTVRMCEITVMVENCGRTPASVTDVRLNICALEYGTTLPTTIDYGKPYPHGAP